MAAKSRSAKLETSRRKAQAQHKAIDINKIRRWQLQYSQGKLSKRQQKNIQAHLEKERSVANRRMKRFSDTGQSSPAYTRALGRLQQAKGAGRKTWGKAADFEDLLMSAGNVNAFVRSDQSTLTGAKRYRAQKIREFRENPKFSSFAGKYTDEQVNNILELLHDDAISDYFDYFADYSEEVEKIAGIMEEKSGENWLKGKLKAHEEFMQETARLDSPFHNKGVSTRELKGLINARYSRIENRRRR